jgi:LAGLIDADG endonuclease
MIFRTKYINIPLTLAGISSRSIFTKINKSLSPMWVTGFTDAEGSFIVSIYKRSDSNKWQIKPFFELGLHSKDINTLEELRKFFGVGIINTRINKKVTSFTVTKNSDLLNVIIPHFSNFPLQTQKRIDFQLWVQIVEIIKKKEHLTQEGLLKILSLKSALNKGLSKNTSEIKNIEVLERPLHLVDYAEFKNIDPNWISGFVAGDGSFDIKITKRQFKYQVELRFRITQHIRDAHILGVIAKYLDCGKVYIRSTNLACDLVINTFPDNINKIIPFFKNHPIGTLKEKDFRDFILAAELITVKAHLTLEGLAKIKEIKLNMNRFR